MGIAFLASIVVALPLALADATNANSPPDAGAYPTPAAAGFHHCALIYEKAKRGVPELMPFVARVHDARPQEWLFDAYLFLTFTSPRGIGTSDGPTIKSDWQHQLDQWFAPGRDLAALDAAIEQAAKTLGPPPSPRQIIFSIPYTHPSVRDFGDVSGDGRSEDLSTPAGRGDVLRWYAGEAQRRFEQAGFRHLKLWGFYWMNEGIAPSDEPVVRDAATQVHALKGRFLWIPWYRAPGWQRWREFGFDVAIMQPNYAFSATHHGRIRRIRLAINADLARQHGLGVEMEAGSLATSASDRRAFVHYMVDGAADRLGYQQAATAYYLGTDTVEKLASSSDPTVRRFYDALADYVAGRKVQDPGPPVVWGIGGDGTISADYLSAPQDCTAAEAHFDTPQEVGEIDVFFDAGDLAKGWHGLVTAEYLAGDDPSATWTPAGWAARLSDDPSSAQWPIATLPIRQKVAALRIAFRPVRSSPLPPRVRAIAPIRAADVSERPHLAMGRPYRVLPAPKASYPDRGHELTDGVVPAGGFPSGRTIGWLNGSVAVQFDLGQAAPVSSITVHCQGGGHAAVNWPATAAVVLSGAGPTPIRLADVGAPPRDARWLLPGPLTIDRKRADNDLDGHLAFQCPPTPARYVTLILDADAWLMLSELRIFANGVNVAPKATYTLHPPPSPATDAGAKYPDDGRRLTDGVVAGEFDAGQLTGWDDGQPRQVVLDLGAAQPVRNVTTWCLGGGLAGIYAPASVQAETSSDATKWQPLGGAVSAPRLGEDSKTSQAVPYRAVTVTPVRARFIRIQITPSKGWAMVSEVQAN